MVSQGEPGKLQYTLAGVFSPFTFSEANQSIESKNHKHTYAFNAPKQPVASPNAGELWYICRITITYQDIFRRKHASIYDLAFLVNEPLGWSDSDLKSGKSRLQDGNW